jgi:hypothetical protein
MLFQLLRWFVVNEDQQVFAEVNGCLKLVLMNKKCLQHTDFLILVFFSHKNFQFCSLEYFYFWLQNAQTKLIKFEQKFHLNLDDFNKIFNFCNMIINGTISTDNTIHVSIFGKTIQLTDHGSCNVSHGAKASAGGAVVKVLADVGSPTT